MGSHKKPLCVGKCTSQDLDFIFFCLWWGGGRGSGGSRHVPSHHLDFKEGLGDVPFGHSTSHDTCVAALYQTLKILKQNSL